MAIVEIRGLTKAYGRRPPALRDVTLEIHEGVTGLLGPNGAGKSTLIQCVLGLLPDFQGDAKVLGLDARRDRREIRRRVGFMPEFDAYLPETTGIKAVRFLGQLTGMPYNHALRRAHEVLFHVGLGEAVYRDVREYSTGMRQRFKLAQALVHDPELLFLDEPLAGLDPKGREELLKLIRRLADRHGKHIIWSSHILPEVQKVADSITVLKEGRSEGTYRLEEFAPRDGVYSIAFDGESPDFRAALDAQDIRVLATDGGESGDAWTVALDPELGSAPIFQLAGEHGVRLRRVKPVSESLEDVFMRILGGHAPSAQSAVSEESHHFETGEDA
ncbi:MAG: ABC transporter ATP-binding protein [Planctomycetota bacterium]|nr:ABC transporter ATP-binding protein [Planctomycetota bacterium]